jgi:hypothetical protein
MPDGTSPRASVSTEIWKCRHALVSFADSQQIVVAAEVAQSFALDEGAF